MLTLKSRLRDILPINSQSYRLAHLFLGSLMLTCALDAGPALAKLAAKNEQFQPVYLKCPSENNDVLEYENKSAHGDRYRLRIAYEKDAPTTLMLEAADAIHPSWDTIAIVNFNSNLDAKTRRAAHRIVTRTEAETKIGCTGNPQARQRYLELLRANAESMKNVR